MTRETARNITPRVSAGYGDGTRHQDSYFNSYFALDIGTGGSTFPVLAAASGTLRRKDEGGGVGLYIRHNDYWQTKYLHLSACGLIADPATGAAVEAGNRPFPVNQGQLLGWAANPNGGIHLHFELRGGSTSNFSSFPSDPGNVSGRGNCCGNRTCNWSYPVDLPDVAIPDGAAMNPGDRQHCPPPDHCRSLSSEPAPQQAMACCLASPPVIPGGMWIEPANGTRFASSRVRFAARAYPTNPNDPAIDHVNFTLWWPGYGPRAGPWLVACDPSRPREDDIYSCDVDLARLGVPEGEVTISFDVHDTAGNYNLAPHGLRIITWSQDRGCPAGQIRCDGECVDPRANHNHCGRCNNRCGIFQICCGDDCGCDGSVLVPFWCMGAEVIC